MFEKESKLQQNDIIYAFLLTSFKLVFIMKLLFFMFLLRGVNPDSLPPKPELFATLRLFHAETDSANVEGLKISKKYEWMHWMPSVGVTLGKPTIGFSLGTVAANIETKAQRKAEKAKILRGGVLAFKTDSFSLVSLLERHTILTRSLSYLESVERIESKAFELQKTKFTEGEVLPLDWLQLQSAHLRGGEPYRNRLEEIGLLEIEIRKTAKY